MTRPNKIVTIEISIPLDAFEQGNELTPSGSILSGHWINIGQCVPIVTIQGLPKDTDVEATFNAYRKSLSLRSIKERKEAAPVKAKKLVTKAFT